MGVWRKRRLAGHANRASASFRICVVIELAGLIPSACC